MKNISNDNNFKLDLPEVSFEEILYLRLAEDYPMTPKVQDKPIFTFTEESIRPHSGSYSSSLILKHIEESKEDDNFSFEATGELGEDDDFSLETIEDSKEDVVPFFGESFTPGEGLE